MFPGIKQAPVIRTKLEQQSYAYSKRNSKNVLEAEASELLTKAYVGSK